MIELKHILEAVSEALSVPPAKLLSPSRTRRTVEARHVCMYLARCLTSESWGKIGRYFGRDHSTACYGHKRISQRMTGCAEFQTDVEEIQYELEIEEIRRDARARRAKDLASTQGVIGREELELFIEALEKTVVACKKAAAIYERVISD